MKNCSGKQASSEIAQSRERFLEIKQRALGGEAVTQEKPRYEYIRLVFDFDDLSELNSLSSTGWRVIAVRPVFDSNFDHYALLERKLMD